MDLRRPFSLLVSLTRLCIESISGNIPWSNISVANRDSILAILPTLTHLELRGVSHFPMLLSHGSSTLEDVFYPILTSDVAAYEGSPIPLRNLSLFHVTNLNNFVPWILLPESPFDVSGLRSLEFQSFDNYFDRPHTLIRHLVHASAPRLQRLCLKHHEKSSLSLYIYAWD
ncbi:hypothetical protein C8R45DRAFT_190987 [Mycena sanguinolenta]|nr:hypothetical protein C8R45DRAFT_190987 [Mycena sanguinolenta]